MTCRRNSGTSSDEEFRKQEMINCTNSFNLVQWFGLYYLTWCMVRTISVPQRNDVSLQQNKKSYKSPIYITASTKTSLENIMSEFQMWTKYWTKLENELKWLNSWASFKIRRSRSDVIKQYRRKIRYSVFWILWSRIRSHDNLLWQRRSISVACKSRKFSKDLQKTTCVLRS